MTNKYKVHGYCTYKKEWRVIKLDGLMCNGGWKTKEDAQKSCDKWNNRKNSWDI